MRVLLIDDNAGIRDLLKDRLAQTGCCTVVGEAEDAESAVSVIGERRPELVVMDWAMPGRDGVWTTRQVKSIFPDVEVVAFTTTGDRELTEKFMAAGASAHFEKADLFRLIDWVVKRAGNGSAPAYI